MDLISNGIDQKICFLCSKYGLIKYRKEKVNCEVWKTLAVRLVYEKAMGYWKLENGKKWGIFVLGDDKTVIFVSLFVVSDDGMVIFASPLVIRWCYQNPSSNILNQKICMCYNNSYCILHKFLRVAIVCNMSYILCIRYTFLFCNNVLIDARFKQ